MLYNVYRNLIFWISFFVVLSQISYSQEKDRFLLDSAYLKNGSYHTNHYEQLKDYAPGFNKFILKAIDIVQATAPDGGGYFANIKAQPPETPIGYELKLFGKSLFKPQRKTSFCSGATYAVFIEALNMIYADSTKELDFERFEAFRMEELDGKRREDGVKFWGKWNDDGYGNHYAMVQYSKIGTRISPEEALPGDFVNISWTNGGGHSTVFLGWYIDEKGEKRLMYFSSQKSTNGLADQGVKISNIKELCFVRLTNPDNIFTFDVNEPYDRKIKGDINKW